MIEHRQFSPSVARNRDAILAVLRQVFPVAGRVLEVASGTGEHTVHFAAALPQLVFQPSDPDIEALASIAGWIERENLSNVAPPIQQDAAAPNWPVVVVNAVICINMVHISPWQASCGLMTGAGAVLGKDGLLYLYGPFTRNGQHSAPSNAEFDASLRARYPEWGVRDVADLAALAKASGFSAPAIVEMPANNTSLLLRRL